MQKSLGFHLFNIALIATIIVLGHLCITEPNIIQLHTLLYLSIACLVIRLWVAALTRISRSNITDGLKFCWVLLVIFTPVIGSIAALFVLRESVEPPFTLKANRPPRTTQR